MTTGAHVSRRIQPRPRGAPIEPAESARMLQMHRGGFKYSQIARATMRSPGVVRAHILRKLAEEEARRSESEEYDTAWARRLRGEGLSDEEIARAMCTTLARVRYLIGQERGAPRPDTQERIEAVYAAIVAHKREHDGVAPTLEELAQATGYGSKSSVGRALEQLERQGRIRLGAHAAARCIEVVGARWSPPSAGSPPQAGTG